MDIWQPGDERPDLSGGYSFEWTIQLQNGMQYYICSGGGQEFMILPDESKIEFHVAMVQQFEEICVLE